MASRRARSRANARPWAAGEYVPYDEHDPTPWPLPERHAGDFGERRTCEQGCNGCDECTDFEGEPQCSDRC